MGEMNIPLYYSYKVIILVSLDAYVIDILFKILIFQIARDNWYVILLKRVVLQWFLQHVESRTSI
jgi:hypothetical protein